MRYYYEILMELEISRQILEKYKKRNIMKIPTMGAELFYADGQTQRQMDGQTGRQTDITKPIVVFRNFSKAHKMSITAFQSLGHNIRNDLNLQ